MLKIKNRKLERQRRHNRVRAKVMGSATRPRLCVHKSLRFLSIQAIDDAAGKTLAQAHLKELKKEKGLTVQGAEALGALFAERLKKANISEGVFDRGGYRYHGRVKALAEAIRKEGITL